eukprot:6892583-Lingulodinium_polyedra.AAC.1
MQRRALGRSHGPRSLAYCPNGPNYSWLTRRSCGQLLDTGTRGIYHEEPNRWHHPLPEIPCK